MLEMFDLPVQLAIKNRCKRNNNTISRVRTVHSTHIYFMNSGKVQHGVSIHEKVNDKMMCDFKSKILTA